MDSDKNYQDLISQYQILLEKEKRRLNFVTEKCASVAENDDEIVLETIESDVSKDESHKFEEDDRSPSETSPKEVVFTPAIENHGKDRSEEMKHDIHKRTKMMEQWVTDSFYTSFPSFKQQDLNANRLADDRREDYKKYLAEVSNKKLLDAVRIRRKAGGHSDSDESTFSKPSERVPLSSRDKLLNDLKHSDLAFNFHNAGAIDDRNQKVAMDRARKKRELQQELMRQIEEKKLQIEKLRAKEMEEEEILQRRLENQIKALQMADELTKRNNEKTLTSNPVNHSTRTRDPIPRRDFEGYTDNFKSADGFQDKRNDVSANNDRQIYKFFSNSAPSAHDEVHANFYNHPVGFNTMALVDPHLHPHTSVAVHNPSHHQHCNRCQRAVPILCNSCSHNDFRCYRCNLLQNMDSCNSCRRAWVQSWNHHGDVERCGVNVYQRRDNRPQILEIAYQDHSSQTNRSSMSPPKSDRINNNRSNSPDTSRSSLGHISQNDNHPSSMKHSDKIVGIGSTTLKNVPETVSLSKDDEILELKRKNDMLIAKYAQNYGSLRNRKTVSKQTNPEPQLTDDSFPLPLMRDHLSPRSSSRSGDVVESTKRENSQAVRKLEYKWEIPVVQKQVITNKPDKVLTQIGAISKQLQLERMNFSND